VKSKEIDLRYTPITCTSHPIIRLSNVVSSLAFEGVDEIRIILREDDIPREALKLFLSKYNYTIDKVEELDGDVLLVIAKRIS